jgi:hypothetical protein
MYWMQAILFAYLSMSCDNQTESEIQELIVHVDTVQIDPREEILFLNWGLDQSQLSKDKVYLYNFNRNDFTLEKIDLDKLSLDDPRSGHIDPSKNGFGSINLLD